jgi:hypothetical protein
LIFGKVLQPSSLLENIPNLRSIFMERRFVYRRAVIKILLRK